VTSCPNLKFKKFFPISGHVFFIEIVRKNTQGYLNLISTYSVWAGYMLILVLASAFFVRLISPSAIGSGIPEMKVGNKFFLIFKILFRQYFEVLFSKNF